jgi:digeranylgeranylglycerophospholipid reductase
VGYNHGYPGITAESALPGEGGKTHLPLTITAKGGSMKKTYKYDVVVIGCGPSGAMAGRAAAQNGAKTLIIEKKLDIGCPMQCGSAIGMVPVLEKELGIKIDSSVYTTQQLTQMRLYAPSGKFTTWPLHGTVIKRMLLDKQLAREAARAGADIMINTRASGIIKEGDFIKGVRAESAEESFEVKTSVVIGADGYASNSARWGGLKRPANLVHTINFQYVRVRNPYPEGFVAFYSPRFAAGAHAWVVREGDDIANVGLGYRPTLFKKILKERISLREMHSRLVAHPVLSSWLEGATVTGMWGGAFPEAPIEKTVSNGLLVVGDAAGIIWPSGAGIPRAMLSGAFAGEVAAKAVKEGDTSEQRLKEYEDRWRRELGKGIEFWAEGQGVFEKIVSSDELINKAFDEIPKVFAGLCYGGKDYVEPAKDWLAAIKRQGA